MERGDLIHRQKVEATLRGLLSGQRLAVVATHTAGQPYANLVAFAESPDLMSLFFATARSTRKYENLAADRRVALLIDSRRNREGDFHEAAAATVIGVATETKVVEKEGALGVFLAKHPYLEEFVRAPTCALFRVCVKKYILVRNFQDVMEWRVEAESG
ncbi:MAG: pyridoxamine 5'-phosphate oxidase family protein [Desulfobacterales bacterium]|jgi:nitroimidazol reductase NimA-like FMN-containing flavoprotein (pyridoxamine 5'-phosphate oxidase superfamily)|nr:pyridoxamine 5'-phosphate oxidase family protein [Desulfobacterales bacterium]